MLKIALDKFKNTNINNILIIYKDFNLTSKKLIEKNGSVNENTYRNNEDGFKYLRY